MSLTTPPTTKGARQAEEILEAALRCLGRDGYAATSLSRVADEAGVSKRMVLYYFDSREELFVQLARTTGQRLIGQLRLALAGIQDPSEAMHTGFGLLWDAITADRGLLIALFGISIEAVTDERLAEANSEFKDNLRGLLRAQLDLARAHGRAVTIDDDVLVTVMISGFLGLAFEWLQSGDSPALQTTIAGYEQTVAGFVTTA